MLLDQPLPFLEAMSKLASKSLLPTNMSSRELQTLNKDIRERSLFSARTLLTDLLQGYKDKVAEVLQPQRSAPGFSPASDFATARLQIKDLLQQIGYRPEPGDAGTIKDLSSNQRINLVLKTNTELAQGWGQKRQGQDEVVLDEYPAQELYRLEARHNERPWLQRFREAGDATGDPIGTGWTITPGGRMVALKNHDIWDQLGSSDNFDDALDVDYPPFAFNSGMWVEDVDRDEAMALGLIDRDTQVAPDISSFELSASAGGRPIFANYDPTEPRDDDGKWTADGSGENLTLYRASDSPDTHPDAHFSEQEDDAKSYTDNPGFGGSQVHTYHIHAQAALKLDQRNAHDLVPLARAYAKIKEGDAGEIAEKWRDNGYDTAFSVLENAKGVNSALAEHHDFIRFLDDFPENARTWKQLRPGTFKPA